MIKYRKVHKTLFDTCVGLVRYETINQCQLVTRIFKILIHLPKTMI